MTDVEETGGEETGGEETGSVDNATKVLDYLVQQVVDNPDEVSVTVVPVAAPRSSSTCAWPTETWAA